MASKEVSPNKINQILVGYQEYTTKIYPETIWIHTRQLALEMKTCESTISAGTLRLFNANLLVRKQFVKENFNRSKCNFFKYALKSLHDKLPATTVARML